MWSNDSIYLKGKSSPLKGVSNDKKTEFTPEIKQEVALEKSVER